jgi:uncharacterized protein YdiU (UPF0061 family)
MNQENKALAIAHAAQPSAPHPAAPQPSAPQLGRAGALRLGFQNTYARLPERFYARVDPTPVKAPQLIRLNTELALFLGLDPEVLAGPQGVAMLSGNRIAEDSEPLAIAYAGHQFGNFVPQLGDGRANLLGELMGRNRQRYDVQLKGSGPTPFSRRGDGRAALGPVLREYLVSEAMAALGVPTTRALAAVTTGESVQREVRQPGAIFTRVAASHLRVGTFQYFAARDDFEGIRILADYAIERHYPELAQQPSRYSSLLHSVIGRHAHLVAQWMSFGFVHGVMNTDNTSISGETIDYGPCAFLEAYDPDMTFSSIDLRGRYAYSNQPAAAHWNLARLAEALLPLLELEDGTSDAALAAAHAALDTFLPQFEAAHLAGMRRKLGLLHEQPEDAALVQGLLDVMARQQADFTLTFRGLCDAAASPKQDQRLRSVFQDFDAFTPWLLQWHARAEKELRSNSDRAAAMEVVNPFLIPRNHRVEAAIAAAVTRGDYGPFENLLEAVAAPFSEQSHFAEFGKPALVHERVTQTFCGT